MFNKMVCLEASFFRSTSPYRSKREVEKTKTITFFLKKELLKEEIFTILLQSQLN